MVWINLELKSLAILISGLYISSKNLHFYAIPSELFYDAAALFEDFLKSWDYPKLSFEEVIQNRLLIIPKDLLEDAESYQNNSIYVEKVVGRILYVITFDLR